MKSWYSIKALSDNPNALEIDIFDEIGDYGVRFVDFARELDQYPDVKEINLRINSPGGDVVDGFGIYNLLRAHPGTKTATIYGVANSMASVVTMAADKVVMPDNTTMFLHQPLLGILGWFHGDELREMAKYVDGSTPAIISAYQRKTGRSAEEINGLLTAGKAIRGTRLTAREAKELGFADEVTDPVKLVARFDLAKLKDIPQLAGLAEKFTFEKADPDRAPEPTGLENLQPRLPQSGIVVTADERPPPPPVETQPVALDPSNADLALAVARREAALLVEACAKAGVPEAATQFISDGLTLDQVETKLAAADKIRALCTAAHLPDRANGYIKAGLTEDEARKELWAVVLNRDQTGEINNKLGPEAERSEVAPKKTATSAEIYALRAKRLQAVKKA